MCLAPVIFFCIWGGMRVDLWAYTTTFVLAMGASVVYFLDTSGHVPLLGWAFGNIHSYTKLLIVSAFLLASGCILFALGVNRAATAEAALAK